MRKSCGSHEIWSCERKRLSHNCCHRPRRRAIQYAEAVVIETMARGVLDAPPSRGMTPLLMALSLPIHERAHQPRRLVREERLAEDFDAQIYRLGQRQFLPLSQQ